MQQTNLSLILALSTALLLTGCGNQNAEQAETSNLANIVIALEPDKDPDQILADQQALQQYLADATELPVEVIIPMSSAVIREGLRNGTIDVAYLSSTAAVRLEDAGIAELLLATEIDGLPYYQSYWLGLADSPLDSVEALRGRPIAFASRTSTSGFIIPVWDLYKKGLMNLESGPEGFFGEGNVSFGVGYVSAVEHVLQGRADAAAVSYYVFEKDKHLSSEQRQRLKVIASQGPVPSHVIMTRPAVGAQGIAELRRVLIEMNEKAPELRDRIFGSPLVEAESHQHFAVTREALDVVEKLMD